MGWMWEQQCLSKYFAVFPEIRFCIGVHFPAPVEEAALLKTEDDLTINSVARDSQVKVYRLLIGGGWAANTSSEIRLGENNHWIKTLQKSYWFLLIQIRKQRFLLGKQRLTTYTGWNRIKEYLTELSFRLIPSLNQSHTKLRTKQSEGRLF